MRPTVRIGCAGYSARSGATSIRRIPFASPQPGDTAPRRRWITLAESRGSEGGASGSPASPGRVPDVAAEVREDSTFTLERAEIDPNQASFRSVKFPDRFIRHRDRQLFAEPVSTPEELQSACFRIDSPLDPGQQLVGEVSDRARRGGQIHRADPQACAWGRRPLRRACPAARTCSARPAGPRSGRCGPGHQAALCAAPRNEPVRPPLGGGRPTCGYAKPRTRSGGCTVVDEADPKVAVWRRHR
ncbi:AbfB domain-containing protein [Streptomyces sp. NPDC005349]|uniref:AbfB domain-containing protein n=1 Tax=Streptomyces sp. NPDC005349 TaxID=3157037 RepID=UPI0033A95D86